MHISVPFLICLNSFVVFSQAAYILVDDYTAANFFSEFDFFSVGPAGNNHQSECNRLGIVSYDDIILERRSHTRLCQLS